MELYEQTATPPQAEDMATRLSRLLDEVEKGGAPPVGSPPATTMPAEGSPGGESPIATPPTGGVALGGTAPLLGSLLQNPALLSAIPALVENLSPLLEGLGGTEGRPAASRKPYPVDRHTALLCAIKPYLSSERQGAAETVIRLCRVWDALGRSGISLSGLLPAIGAAPAHPATEGRDENVQ